MYAEQLVLPYIFITICCSILEKKVKIYSSSEQFDNKKIFVHQAEGPNFNRFYYITLTFNIKHI